MTRPKVKTPYRAIHGEESHGEWSESLPLKPSNCNDWLPVNDLDEFYKGIYEYHQANGFKPIMALKITKCVLSRIILLFVLFMFKCFRIQVALRISPPPGKTEIPDDIDIEDVFIPFSELTFGFLWIFAFICFSVHCFYGLYDICSTFSSTRKTRNFFMGALGIEDDQLTNFNWTEMLKKLLVAQKEYNFAIYSEEISEMDINHRILRHKNFLIALINSKKIDLTLTIPFKGKIIYYTKGIELNLMWILLRGYGAPFVTSYHLHEDYKQKSKLDILAKGLKRRFILFGILNLILTPFIFIGNLMYVMFISVSSYSPTNIRNIYCWSFYSHIYLRHFNELDHEFEERLSRAYDHARMYVDDHISKTLVLMIEIGVVVLLVLLCIGTTLLVLLQEAIVVPFMSTAWIILFRFIWCSIPNKTRVINPELHLTDTLNIIHYSPEDWNGIAHKKRVYDRFCKLFPLQYKETVEQTLSPFVTPWLLIFVYPRYARSIVEFFHTSTIEVNKLGDVCSYAYMTPLFTKKEKEDEQKYCDPSNMKRAETSLLNFAMNNPDYEMSAGAKQFVDKIYDQSVENAKSRSCSKPCDDAHTTEGNPKCITEEAFETLRMRQSEFGVSSHNYMQVLPQVIPKPRYLHMYHNELSAEGEVESEVNLTC